MFGGRDQSKDQVLAVRVIRVSRPLPSTFVVEGDDGELYHVRLTRQEEQRGVYANTWICGIAALAIGLPINPQRTVILPSRVIRDLPQGASPNQAEIAIGDSTTVLADLIAGPRIGPLRTFSFLPQCSVKYVKNKQDLMGMYLFDIWVERGVARNMLFNRVGRTREIRATFVNDGSVLAGQHCSRQAVLDSLYRQPRTLYEGMWSHGQAVLWLDRFRRAIPEALTSAVSSMPAVWRSHGDHVTLCRHLTERLESLEKLAVAYSLPDTAIWNTAAGIPRIRTEDSTAIA